MLNRDSIRDGIVYKLLQQHQHISNISPKSAEERAASLNATLAEAPAGNYPNIRASLELYISFC